MRKAESDECSEEVSQRATGLRKAGEETHAAEAGRCRDCRLLLAEPTRLPAEPPLLLAPDDGRGCRYLPAPPLLTLLLGRMQLRCQR